MSTETLKEKRRRRRQSYLAGVKTDPARVEARLKRRRLAWAKNKAKREADPVLSAARNARRDALNAAYRAARKVVACQLRAAE